MNGLKSLAQIGIPADALIVENIENSLIWQSRRASLADLHTIMIFAAKRRSDSNMGRKLFEEIIRMIELRWVEIEEPAMVAKFFNSAEHFSDKFLARIEDRMTNCAEEMSSVSIIIVSFLYGFCYVF